MAIFHNSKVIDFWSQHPMQSIGEFLRLKILVPKLFGLVDCDHLNWNKIEGKFQQVFDERDYSLSQTKASFIEVKTSFYDLIADAYGKYRNAKSLLSFINSLFEELSENLSKKEKSHIIDTIYYLLTNFDNNYLNFIGELAALNNRKKSGRYILLGTEEPLNPSDPNSTKADFKILNTDTATEELLEVLNIHLTNSNTANDFEIERLFDQKVREKVLRTAKQTNRDFILETIIWGTIDQVRKIRIYYDCHHPTLEKSLPIMCLVTTTDNSNILSHTFGPITKIDKERLFAEKD